MKTKAKDFDKIFDKGENITKAEIAVTRIPTAAKRVLRLKD
jgi:hypothetical protein